VIHLSHDRGLLNRAVGGILHLEDVKLTGNYQGLINDQFRRKCGPKSAHN